MTSLLLAVLSSAGAIAAPVTEQRDWNETFDVGSDPVLSIDNIWGDITIKAGGGDRIEMSIRIVRQADDQESFDRSLEQIPLAIEQHGNGVSLRVGRDYRGWRDRPRCNGCKLRVDLVVSVPADASLDVSTVNDGDIVIAGITGRVTAANVNGSVSVGGLTQCIDVETINGDLEIEFVMSPQTDCRIETLNGDIDLSLSADADVRFAVELSNGKLRSTLDLAPYAIPASVSQTTRDGRNYYNIEQLAGLQLGRGGRTLTLKSLNGDVRVAGSK